MVDITIGIPVKNSESTIGHCLKSILSSNFDLNRMEIIIVDGGSTDNTLAIAQKILKESGIKHKVLYDKGRGVAYARQMILNGSSGEYIVWIDSDNIIPQNYIKKGIETLLKDRKIGAVYPQMIVPIGGKSIIERLQIYYMLTRAKILSQSYRKQNIASFPAMQGTITRISALREIGGFDTSLIAGEDIDVFIRMYLNGWKLKSADITLYYHVRKSWRAVFAQAVWWGYGRYFVSKKHKNLIHPILELVERRQYEKQLPLQVLYTVEFLKLLEHSTKMFKTIELLALPLFYSYRRVGYFVGYDVAKKHSERKGMHYE